MDILNFISWIRGRRQVTTVDPAKTLIPIGLKDGRRDDEYLAGAITVQDLAAQIAPQPTYKVYTALLTQSGGDDPQTISSGALTAGVSYEPGSASVLGSWDFSNVGGPKYPELYPFVATASEEPNSWTGVTSLNYNTGAPVVTVLENTLGINLTFSYLGVGVYTVNNPNGWDRTKLWYGTSGLGDSGGLNVNPGRVVISIEGPNPDMLIICYNNDYSSNIDQQLLETPIEIRVYN